MRGLRAGLPATDVSCSGDIGGLPGDLADRHTSVHVHELTMLQAAQGERP
jgi:hypothetical protein